MIAASNDESRHHDDGGPLEPCVGQLARGDATKPLHVIACPHLCTQNPEAHLHERVVQVNEHYVVAPFGDRVVERYGPNALGVRVFKAIEAPRP